MTCSAYKLNKQGDNIQLWHVPFPIWNQSVVPCLILTISSWFAYRCHICIHSSVHGHLGCFHVLALVNSAAVNIGVHVSFQIRFFSWYMLNSGIGESYGSLLLMGKRLLSVSDDFSLGQIKIALWMKFSRKMPNRSNCDDYLWDRALTLTILIFPVVFMWDCFLKTVIVGRWFSFQCGARERELVIR